MFTTSDFPVLTPDEAAELVVDGATIGYSGFTGAGAPKATPRAITARMRALHARGDSMVVRVLTGAGMGAVSDDELIDDERAEANGGSAAAWAVSSKRCGHRYPLLDMHSAQLPQMVELGLFGDIDLAVVEAVDVVRDGRVYLSTSSGFTPSLLRRAAKVVIEINNNHSSRLAELHDISVASNPPHRLHIPLEDVLGRIGAPFATVDPKKIVGVVETDEPDGVTPFDPPNEVSERIADHIARFLSEEIASGRIPQEFLPVQAGAGSLVNAVLGSLGRREIMPPFQVYGDHFQDALVELMELDRLRGASATSLTLSADRLRRVFDDMDFFASRVVLRPQEITNNRSIVQRLGVISVNSALEVDLFGCANSTGRRPGRARAGGSGDFVRNAYLSFLVMASAPREGRVSAVVPMVTHVDYSEHIPLIVVTEQGLADLRGLDRRQRAEALIGRCAHPLYRDYLYNYLNSAPLHRSREDPQRAFELHRNLMASGSMLPGWASL